MRESTLVSVIIPVYNVENYVDQCMESVVGQTYQNIEIILINDGSTDNSFQKCKEWVDRDKRIIFKNRINQGLSMTRNWGIKHSQGEYLMFIDSDDWIDRHYIEKMVNRVKLENADIGICDYYKINDSGNKQYISCNAPENSVYDKWEYLLLSNTAVWNKIISRDFWNKHDLQFENVVSEDTGLFPMLILLSKQVVGVDEPLYYYRKFRVGSITSTISNRRLFAKAYQFTVNYFQKNELFKKYENILYRYFLEWTSNSLAPCLGYVSEPQYREIRGTFIDFLEKNFKLKRMKKTAVFGGYNLTRIARLTSLFSDPYYRVQFSSIIALGAPVSDGGVVPVHKNVYRNFMLSREFNKDFYRVLDEEKPEYILIDFLEERHDIAIIDKEYRTYSDAFKESSFEKDFEIIERTSLVCSSIWEEACINFIEELKKRFLPHHVILVKNYLSEVHSNGYEKKEFNNINKIRMINKILRKYYTFFENHFQEVQIVDYSEDPDYFSDDRYEYGCFSWHLNNKINYKISNMIETLI